VSSFIAAIWNSIGSFQPQILAFVLTTLGGVIAYALRPKVKLIWGRANNSFHTLRPAEQQTVNVYCEKLYVQNLGSKSAEHVEIILSGVPSELAIYPPRQYERKGIENGQLLIALPYIAPRELVIVDTIHVNSPTAEIVSVHCPEAVGFRVEFWVLRRLRPRYYFGVALLVGLGFFYTTQLLITALAHLFLDR
jgi:hypothetical protein